VTLVGHSVGSRLIFACLQVPLPLPLTPALTDLIDFIGQELSRCQQRYLESIHENSGKPKTSGTMANVGGAMTAPFRAVKSVFHRKSDQAMPAETEAAAAPLPESATGCQVAVAGITSLEREQYDRDDEKQDLYRHAGDIIQDVVLLGTPIGIEVLLLRPFPPSHV
jgi:hypothetical protein